MRNETKNYKIKLKPMSPIHIGTGEAYEPMNYVIDKGADDKYYMYVFDEFEFFKKLDDKSKDEFKKIASDATDVGILKLQKFIKEKGSLAKKVSYYKIQALKNIAEDYNEKIGKVVQREGGGKKVINQLVVEKTLISPNLKKAIIPGSSLKGAIATAFGEMLYKKARNYDTKEYFSDFLVSDSEVVESHTFASVATNIKRNREPRGQNGSQGIPVRYEAINSKSEFKTTFTIKNNKFGIDELIKACNSHYMPIFTSQFDYGTDEFTREALSDKFIEKYEHLKLTDNQFLLRVGKHSSARAVTIDGVRKIKIMKGKGQKPSFGDEETTIWLINKQPFGWLLCEILESY